MTRRSQSIYRRHILKKLLVIIPAYNEEAAILNTIADLRQNCPQADYVVVND